MIINWKICERCKCDHLHHVHDKPRCGLTTPAFAKFVMVPGGLQITHKQAEEIGNTVPERCPYKIEMLMTEKGKK